MNNELSTLNKICQTLPSLAKEIKSKFPDLVSKTDLGIMLSPTLITVDPSFNTRHEGYESLDEYFSVPSHRTYLEKLKAAYRSGEQLPPPIVVQVIDNEIILRDGHCRFFAILELIKEGLNLALIRVDEYKGDASQCDMFILKTQAGITLTPFAVGAVYNRMLNHGMTLDKIAAEFGYTKNQVQNILDMYNMNAQLKKYVLRNIVSGSMMLKLVYNSGLKTDQVIQLIEQQLKTKTKNLLEKFEAKKAKAAKRGGEESSESIEADDETLFAQVIAESETMNNGYNSTSGRGFLKPGDLKAKSLPKKMVEELHSLLSDFDALNDASRIIEEDDSELVLMKISRHDLDKMRELQKRINEHDEANLRRMGAQIEDEDSESANADNLEHSENQTDDQAA